MDPAQDKASTTAAEHAPSRRRTSVAAGAALVLVLVTVFAVQAWRGATSRTVSGFTGEVLDGGLILDWHNVSWADRYVLTRDDQDFATTTVPHWSGRTDHVIHTFSVIPVHRDGAGAEQYGQVTWLRCPVLGKCQTLKSKPAAAQMAPTTPPPPTGGPGAPAASWVGICDQNDPMMEAMVKVDCSQPHLAQAVTTVPSGASSHDCTEAAKQAIVSDQDFGTNAYAIAMGSPDAYVCWIEVMDPGATQNLRVTGSLLDGTMALP